MTALDAILPTPRLLEIDTTDIAAPPEKVWNVVFHGDLGRSALIRALFALREMPAHLAGVRTDIPSLRIENLRSSPAEPGFQTLALDAPREVVVGAIGKVWKLEIPFVHVQDAAAYAAFDSPGFVKVAWAIRVEPLGEKQSRLVFELHVDATDDESWTKFQRYFLVIGPASRFIRRSALASFARELGTPDAVENEWPLAGDELLPDAVTQLTHGITIAATRAAIWPWLVQLGCRRGGYYSWDILDNAGVRSAREIHPELQDLKVGDVIASTPEGMEGFEVLRIDPPRALVLGHLFDVQRKVQLPFASARPGTYWHMTWAFVLEPLDEGRTRLHVRVRAAFPSKQRLQMLAIKPVHAFMEHAQLRHLAARVEGRLPADDIRDVASGIGGAARIAVALLTPGLRRARSHWGVDEATAKRTFAGDELVAKPRWGWTHGVEIDAPAAKVWPWIAQIGADRGGFYSYQWLENLVGCELRNAEAIHPEWELHKGDGLSLAPSAPPLRVVDVEPGRHIVTYAAPDAAAQSANAPWATATWAFFVEPLGEARCRLISRYRCDCSHDFATRLTMGPAFAEPIGFVMDRRMLLGVKERAERPIESEKRTAELY